MNRQLKPLFLLGTALLLATACTNDDTDTVDITRPIDLHLSPARTVTAETKVDIDGEAFDPDDVIGLYLAWTDGATDTVDITQTITQTTWKGNAFAGESLYWQNTADEHTIYAYYPHTADVTDDHKVTVTIPDVQTADDEETCNILYGTFSGTARNNVQIQMRHCMSLVNITLKKGAGYGENEPMPDIDKVTLRLHLHTSGTLDLATGKVTADEEGTTPDITTYLLTDDTPDVPDYRAILMPGETLDYIKITTDDGTPYEYEPETAPVTEANTQYNFTLERNKAGVTLGNLTIEKWAEEVIDESGDANMQIKPEYGPSN